MAFNINEFKANGLVYGGSRSSQFKVTITPPSGLTSTANAAKISFVAKAASLPPSNLGTIKVPYFGRTVPYAGDRDFPDWAITIMNDEDFVVRAIFEKWSNRINSLVGNIRIPNNGDLEDYMVDGIVSQLGKDGSEIRSYKFLNMFPNTVAEIGTDWEAANQIEQFAVNFSYWAWEPLNEGQYADSYIDEVDTNDTTTQ